MVCIYTHQNIMCHKYHSYTYIYIYNMYMYIYIHTHKKSPPLVSGDYNDRYTVDERISQGKKHAGTMQAGFH